MLHHLFLFFFFNDTATTEIYTLSLHDALPIFGRRILPLGVSSATILLRAFSAEHFGNEFIDVNARGVRSEEHTSELQSRLHLVCRLLLEKKKKKIKTQIIII